MKTLLMGLAAVGAITAGAADVDNVLVRQMWPWSTDVRVEYRLTNVTAPVNLKVRAWNGSTELDADTLKDAISGDIYGLAADGTGRITIDPVKAFGSAQTALGKFKVELTAEDAPEDVNEVLYKIIDMASGAIEDVKRSDFYNGYRGSYETNFSKVCSGFTTTLSDVLVWTDVTNHTEYMTSKMVFRKIKAKGVTWQMGEMDSGVTEKYMNSPYWVQLTNDYYIGVFPVTQYQYNSLRKMRGKYFTNETAYVDRDYYPVAGVSWGELRGYDYGTAKNWPSNGHEVPAWTASAVMRKRTGLLIDLPTEAQWEFACRAGVYDKALYSGKSFSSSTIMEVSWNNENSDSVIHPVNTKPANAFGLYSMLGNCYEWTLCANNNYPDSSLYTEENPCLEPDGGTSSGNYKMARSCPYSYGRGGVTAALRSGIKLDSENYCTGFRFWFPAE